MNIPDYEHRLSMKPDYAWSLTTQIMNNSDNEQPRLNNPDYAWTTQTINNPDYKPRL